jgi:decaprenyl-phosphate phosphoribosyltransferase
VVVVPVPRVGNGTVCIRPMDATAPSAVPADRTSSRTPALVRLLRPRQWPKNLLVLAAPFAAGELSEADVAIAAALAFVAFSLVASGVYCLNDARDVEADRAHPTKRTRPIASGEVSVGVGWALGGLLLVAGLALGLLVEPRLLLVLAGYVAVNVAYGLGLKDVPVFDIAAVASGFVLRAVAGGAAVQVPISQWFLIVAGFGSLFVVAGKRSAEHLDLGDEAGAIRTTLTHYSLDYLRFVRTIAAGVCLAGYCLWAFERPEEIGGGEIWYELSIIPFVLGILHYGLRLEQGAGAAPEELALKDRPLQVLGVVWVVLVGLGVNGA